MPMADTPAAAETASKNCFTRQNFTTVLRSMAARGGSDSPVDAVRRQLFSSNVTSTAASSSSSSKDADNSLFPPLPSQDHSHGAMSDKPSDSLLADPLPSHDKPSDSLLVDLDTSPAPQASFDSSIVSQPSANNHSHLPAMAVGASPMASSSSSPQLAALKRLHSEEKQSRHYLALREQTIVELEGEISDLHSEIASLKKDLYAHEMEEESMKQLCDGVILLTVTSTDFGFLCYIYYYM
jgi:hypothetical protein